MSVRKPKDLQMAEVAYNTFYSEAPQVPFDDLATSYQMRWVRVVRAASRLRTSAPANGGGSQPVRTKEAAQAKPSKKAKKANGAYNAGARSPYVLAEWKKWDEDDKALLTDKKWKDKTKEEIHAIHRIAYRQKQRKKHGLLEATSATT